MRGILSLILIATVMLPLQSSEAEPATKNTKWTIRKPTSASQWKDKEGNIRRKTINARMIYRYLEVTKEKGPEDILFLETVENEPVVKGEGTISKVSIEAHRCSATDCSEIIWAISDTSDDCKYLAFENGSQYYKTTKYGCCGGEDLSRIYDIRSGKYLYQCTEDGLAILGSQKSSRVAVAYISVHGQELPGRLSDNKGEMGIVSLYIKDELSSQVIIVSHELDPWTPKVTLWPDRVELTYQNGHTVNLQINHSIIDVNNVKSDVHVKVVPFQKEK